MKIVEYCPHALAGDMGSAVAVRGWCTALTHAGVNVRLLVDPARIAMPAPEGVECVPVVHRFHGKLTVPTRFDSALDRADLVVLHGGWVPANALAGWSARSKGIPYILTPQGAYEPRVVRRNGRRKRAWNFAFERRLLRRALAVHVFFAEEESYLRALGAPVSLVVAPNGVAERARRWDGGSGEYLLWLGRYDVPGKGLDLLIDALRLLPPETRPVLRLHGPDYRGGKRAVSRLVQAGGLERWVMVGDRIDRENKWNLLTGAAAFVYPSRWECFAVSVAEALSMGIPTLVGSYPLGRRVAAEGGAVLAEDTPASVAAGIKRILSPEAAAIGRRGLEVAREHFSWDELAASWVRQVRALMGSETAAGEARSTERT